MNEVSDAAKAEQMTKRRSRALPTLALLLVGQQVVYFTQARPQPAASSTHIAAWLVLSVGIIIILVTGGGWFYSRDVRRLANDELTRVHRDRAFRAGFIASMAACVLLYFVSMFHPLAGRDAIHLVMTAGVLVALLWFGFLERRAHAGG